MIKMQESSIILALSLNAGNAGVKKGQILLFLNWHLKSKSTAWKKP